MKANRTSSRLGTVLVIGGTLLFLLAVYLVGYLSCRIEERAVGYDRCVRFNWQAALFAPAARVESAINGNPVNLRNARGDRKSTRLNSSHSQISYAVFC